MRSPLSEVAMARLDRVRKTGPWAIAIVAGATYATLFPPLSISWYAWFALVPLLLLIRDEPSPLRCAAFAGLFGAAAACATVSWLPVSLREGFGLPQPTALLVTAAVVLQASFWFAVFGAMATRLRRGPVPNVVAIPAAWSVCEVARTQLPGGLPWLPLGVSQWQSLDLLQWSEWVGTTGLGLLLVAGNVLFGELVFAIWKDGDERLRNGRRAAIVAASLPCFMMLAGSFRLDSLDAARRDERFVRVGLVHADIPHSERWVEAFREQNLERHLSLTREAVDAGAELVIWSETAIDFLPEDVEPLHRKLAAALGGKAERQLIYGAPRVEGTREGPVARNSLVLVDGTARELGTYAKRRLVPLAESDPPWVDLVPGLRPLLDPLMDGAAYRAGAVADPLETRWGPIGGLICFEANDSWLVRESVARGASVLLLAANDAYLPSKGARQQHLAHAVARAVETRRPVIRIANGGVSGVIRASGRMEALLETMGVSVAEVRVPAIRSVPSWLEPLGPYLALVLPLAALALPSRRHPSRPSQPSTEPTTASDPNRSSLRRREPWTV